MVYMNQVHLSKHGVERNRTFLRLLYGNEDLVDVSKWFEKLDRADRSKPGRDRSMTLETFVEGIHSGSYSILQINSPDFNRIRYYLSYKNFPGRRVENVAWVLCPCNDNNFNIFSELYEEAFGRRLEDEPVIV